MYNDNYLQHYGIIGMKWGLRRGNKQVVKLGKKTGKMASKFDKKGNYDPKKIRKTSDKIRRMDYKNNKRIKKINKYLNNKRLVDLMFDVKKSPKKIELAKQHLEQSQMLSKKISEIRAPLNQLKLDLMF